MAYQNLKVEQSEGVVMVTLSDPSTLNALSPRMSEELIAELARIEDDPEARVIVLTGEGRGFCSGANVRDLQRHGVDVGQRRLTPREELFPDLSFIRRITTSLRFHLKPSIAAVNGAAVGGGFGIALACDIRIAAQDAKMGSVFVRRGIVADDGTLYMLPQVVGLSRAYELTLTGDIIDGREAERIGLVSKAVPASEVVPTALSLAKKIVANSPPITVQLTKLTMTKALDMTFQDSLLLSERATRISLASEDAKEAISAFVEKRAPVFKGR